MDEEKLKRLHDLAVERGDMDIAKRTLMDIKNLREASTLPERPVTLREKLEELKQIMASKLRAGSDVSRTLITGAAAEPIAGLTGLLGDMALERYKIGGQAQPGNQAANMVGDVREALTYQPKTEEGQEALAGLAEFVEPVGEKFQQAEQYLGDKALELTGNPAAAGLATAIPTLGLELAGAGLAKGAAVPLMKAKRIPIEKEIDKSLKKAAPSKEELKASSQRHFEEIDNMGVTVNRESFAGLIERAEKSMKESGGDPRVTADAYGALDAMKETLKKIDEGEAVPLSELETLREIASVAADNPMQPKKQAVALSIVDEIDDFIEGAKPDQFNLPQGVNPNEVGVKYKQAREQWGRYRRSQMLDKAVIKAGDQASGFENGLRIQFRQILNSDKKSRYFTEAEKAAMRQVVNGTSGSNLFKALGKVGIDFGGGNNALLAVITGIGVGYGTDPLTAFAVVGASSVAKKLAERMTKGNADFANQVVRAGNDAREITEAYIRSTPRKLRSADELSLLLLNKNVDVSKLNKFKMEAEAAKLALERRAQLAAVLTGGNQSTDSTTSKGQVLQLPAR